MKNYEIDKAIKEIFELLSLANIYVDNQEPWKLKKTDTQRMNVVLSVCVEIIRRSTIMLYPIIPNSSEKIFSIINLNIKDINFDNYDKFTKNKISIKDPFPIFPRIEIND